jgi:hypothetical protein
MRAVAITDLSHGSPVKKLRGTVPGPLVVERDLDVVGTIAGNAVVRPAQTLHLRGAITGDLTVERGATAIVFGTVGGRVRKLGGTLVITHPDSGRDVPSNTASSSTSNV